MHFISVMGAGLLVGTALIVIIPEGIHTLYFAQLQKGKFSFHYGCVQTSSNFILVFFRLG